MDILGREWSPQFFVQYQISDPHFPQHRASVLLVLKVSVTWSWVSDEARMFVPSKTTNKMSSEVQYSRQTKVMINYNTNIIICGVSYIREETIYRSRSNSHSHLCPISTRSTVHGTPENNFFVEQYSDTLLYPRTKVDSLR
jgi:hypothetical protein